MTTAARSFEPATTRAKLVCGCLWLHSVIADLTIVSGALLWVYADRLETASDFVIMAVVFSAMIRMVAGWLLHLATFLFYVTWLMRVFDNLEYLGAGPLRFGRLSAVASFFIPVGFFVLPPYFLRTAWYGSDPSRLSPDGRQHWPEAWRMPPVVLCWWGSFWAFVAACGQTQERWPKLSGMLARWPTGTLEYAQMTGALEFATGVLYLAAALVAIRMVRQITRWQDQRYEQTIAAFLQRPATTA
jgi:hypothetical protein